MLLRGLHGRKVVDRVRRRGQTWKGKHMKIVYVRGQRTKEMGQRNGQKSQFPIPNSQFLVGTLASTHLDKSAVKRNRMRRRCREALRITLRDAQQSFAPQDDTSCQLLIAPRSSSLTCPFTELTADIGAFLHHLHHGK